MKHITPLGNEEMVRAYLEARSAIGQVWGESMLVYRRAIPPPPPNDLIEVDMADINAASYRRGAVWRPLEYLIWDESFTQEDLPRLAVIISDWAEVIRESIPDLRRRFIAIDPWRAVAVAELSKLGQAYVAGIEFDIGPVKVVPGNQPDRVRARHPVSGHWVDTWLEVALGWVENDTQIIDGLQHIAPKEHALVSRVQKYLGELSKTERIVSLAARRNDTGELEIEVTHWYPEYATHKEIRVIGRKASWNKTRLW